MSIDAAFIAYIVNLINIYSLLEGDIFDITLIKSLRF